MMEQLAFVNENRERIHALDSTFAASRSTLSKQGRVLIGEGHLLKQGRKKPQEKAFFLFNDVLVYASIVLHWHKKQKIIPLEDIQIEDMDDSVNLKNQWLIRTPRKSFMVAAPSLEEKRAWMENIEACRSRLLPGSTQQSAPRLAVNWIPDKATYRCMRCFSKFSLTHRRHHCRKCGFLVCASCSKQRAVIGHIHHTKQLRVCKPCNTRIHEEAEQMSRGRGESADSNNSKDNVAASSEEEEEEEDFYITPSTWLENSSITWGERGPYD